MDAVKFLKERKRLCEMHTGCPNCPAINADGKCIFSFAAVDPDEQVKFVEEWCVSHPRKTRQSVFMEQWPDVYLDGNRVISVSPCTVSKEYRDMDCDLRDCAECRKEFWLKEVK